ncbi:MAG: hypothetical protein CMM49_04245 [Rhodospirillaceae bacterium]|nr:hypothetical protein [Rhodospirillaceae bacterium]|tara:strand:+ start:415 stop:1644 length:1230 start_codon:yes stop_codon:yes gene_type:complete
MIKNIELFNTPDTKLFNNEINRANKFCEEISIEKYNSKYKCLSSDFYDRKYDEIKKILEEWANSFETVVIIATGGSNLGSKSIISSKFKTKNNIKFFYLDNLNSDIISYHISNLDLEKCGFLIISKSGNTIEVVSQSLIFIKLFENKLGKKKLSSHFLSLTTNTNNIISTISREKNIRVIELDNDISGRFSVLSLVGWIPAVIAGIDFGEIVRGSNNIMSTLNKNDSQQIIGAALMSTLSQSQIHVNVLSTYEPRLLTFCNWHKQLFSESLGKNNIGMVTQCSLMPLDQHSQLQAWIDGPKDKIINILINENNGSNIDLDCSGIEVAKFLDKKTISDVINAFIQTTTQSLLESGRPFRIISIDNFDEYTLGELFAFSMLETILTSNLLGLNPFNQPAIEKAKKLTKNYL